MTEHQRPLKVFLSYASQDVSVVQELSARLAAEGWIDPWVDKKKLLPGQDWRTKIEEAVETSDVVLICLSNNSVTKEGFVQKELRYAREIAFEKPDETIFLIPLRLDDCAVPRGLRFYQWADYFGEQADESYSALLESLRLRHEQKLKLEAEENARWEKAEKERIASEEKERRVAEEKARREAQERARREREELERKEAEAKARQRAEEKARQGAYERARIEKEEKEHKAAEVAAQNKAKREIAERTRLEKAKQRAIRFATLKDSVSKSYAVLRSIFAKARPRLRIVGYSGVVLALVWIGSWGISKLAVAVPTAAPSATSTVTLPAKTSTLTPTPTLTLTRTPTFTPTLTFTPTSIPPSSILFQKDFEDGLMGELAQTDEGGIWNIEQEPNGNRSLCGTGPSVNPPQIWYRDRKTVWTDYGFETRVKFIKGNTLFILFRNDLTSGEHYGVALNEYGLGIMRTWSGIGRNFPMLPYPDRWYIVKVHIKGDSLSIYVNNLLFEELTLQPPVINHGGIGYVSDAAGKVCLDDIKVWSLK